ncbi:MAG TPA: recombinase family protein [Polyangiaceae bacterium]|nr:recombinase family protein [Polyangiaceae bacterium]
MTRTPSATILTRVSTDQQAGSGLGREAQLASARAYAAAQGWTVARELAETCSGGRDLADRPVLLDALAGLGKGDVLLVSSWCRLSRSVLTTELVLDRCRATGVRVVSADGQANESSPEAELMRRIIGAVSAWERARIALRTRAALAAKRARGERLGHSVPLGAGSERAAVARAYSLADAGEQPESIARYLLAEGYTGRRGAPITYTTVRRWLARRR